MFNKFVVGYTCGVVTAPAVYYVLRKPLIKHIVVPVLLPWTADKELDATMYSIMSTRLEFQEYRDKHGKEIQQLKAQGYSIDQIAEKMNRKPVMIRGILRSLNSEGEA